MNEKEFIKNHVTKAFLELQPLLATHVAAKRLMNKADRKIRSFEIKYKFLVDIVSHGSDDDFLANAIKSLLKNAGFTKVIHYKDKRQQPKREDIQAWHENDIFIIEVKGINASNPKRTDLIQVAPYLFENRRRYPTSKVYGLSIINHEKQTELTNRKMEFKNDENNRDLVNLEVGAISAIHLIYYFKILKSGKMDFQQFKDKLKQPGFAT